MELAGNEKRIPALFLELKIEDQRLTPPFALLWNRAQMSGAQSFKGFKLSFALAAVLVIAALVSLALWMQRGQRILQPGATVANNSSNKILQPTPIAVNPSPQPAVAVKPRHRFTVSAAARRLAARRRTELIVRNAAVREAAVISSWQSPTVTLMQSPADDVLTTLPQLSQPVNELKSFLPNTPK